MYADTPSKSYPLLLRTSSHPLLAECHERGDKTEEACSIISSSKCALHDSPEDAEDAIIEVDQANVCGRDPDIEKVDDKLVTDGLTSNLEIVELEVALRLKALLSPGLALKFLDIVGEPSSLRTTVSEKQ